MAQQRGDGVVQPVEAVCLQEGGTLTVRRKNIFKCAQCMDGAD